jgi:hypothetical protein
MECRFIFKEFDLAQLADGLTYPPAADVLSPQNRQLGHTLEPFD